MHEPSTLNRIYRLTSIARPVDPAYPTNRALLFVLGIGALVFAGLGASGIIAAGAPQAVVSSLLAGFAAWALARELAPDDNTAAFLSLAVAWVMYVMTGTANVLLAFVALFLVRVMNRSTGLAPRPWDTLLVLAFVLWATVTLRQPLLAMVAALAFAWDASLGDREWRGWGAAVICAGFSLWQILVASVSWQISLIGGVVPMTVALLNVSILVRLRDPQSPCDVSDELLSASRVRAGHLIGVLVGLQAIVVGVRWSDEVVWAVLISVPLSALLQAAAGRSFLPISHHPHRPD